MKKAIIYLISLLLIASCTGNKKAESVCEKQNGEAQQANQKAIDEKVGTVELLYFHGKQRCLTCMAIEKFSTETVAKEFQEQVDSGKLIYKIIDIDKEEALANKYKVASSSLILITHTSQGEKVTNLTQFAFSCARKESEKFCKDLTYIIKGELSLFDTVSGTAPGNAVETVERATPENAIETAKSVTPENAVETAENATPIAE